MGNLNSVKFSHLKRMLNQNHILSLMREWKFYAPIELYKKELKMPIMNCLKWSDCRDINIGGPSV